MRLYPIESTERNPIMRLYPIESTECNLDNYAIVSCITRNPILCALTFCRVKRTQITALKQEGFVLQTAPTCGRSRPHYLTVTFGYSRLPHSRCHQNSN